jgi:hypothetical protein
LSNKVKEGHAIPNVDVSLSLAKLHQQLRCIADVIGAPRGLPEVIPKAILALSMVAGGAGLECHYNSSP